MLFTVKKWQTKNETILISKSHKRGDNHVTMPQTAQNGPHRLGSRKITACPKIMRFATVHAEPCEHIWYKFQKLIMNITEGNIMSLPYQ